LVNEFRSAGVECDRVVYNGLLVVCARDDTASIADGWDVLDEMVASGLSPDAYSYATLLDIAARRGANPLEADRVLKAMEASGATVTTTVLNSYLKVLAKGAATVLKRMADSKVPVDVITLSTHMEILSAAAKHGLATSKDAAECIYFSRKCNVEPTHSMCASWIKVVAEEALMGTATAQQGLDTLNSIRAWIKRKPLKASLYNKALSCVAKAAANSNGSVEHGLEILDIMAEDGVGLSAVSLSSFIQIAKADHNASAVEAAWEVYASAPQAIKSQRVVTMMISCLARAGQRKRARSTLEEAIDCGLVPNCYMFNAAMGACSKPEQVFELHSRMQIAGIEGDAVTQKYLRLAKKGKLAHPGIIAATKIRFRSLRRRQGPPSTNSGS